MFLVDDFFFPYTRALVVMILVGRSANFPEQFVHFLPRLGKSKKAIEEKLANAENLVRYMV